MMTHLGGKADIGCEFLPGAAAVLEALDMQQQDLGQAVQPHTLCGLSLLSTHLALEALIALHCHVHVCTGGIFLHTLQIRYFSLSTYCLTDP